MVRPMESVILSNQTSFRPTEVVAEDVVDEVVGAVIKVNVRFVGNRDILRPFVLNINRFKQILLIMATMIGF